MDKKQNRSIETAGGRGCAARLRQGGRRSAKHRPEGRGWEPHIAQAQEDSGEGRATSQLRGGWLREGPKYWRGGLGAGLLREGGAWERWGGGRLPQSRPGLGAAGWGQAASEEAGLEAGSVPDGS